MRDVEKGVLGLSGCDHELVEHAEGSACPGSHVRGEDTDTRHHVRLDESFRRSRRRDWPATPLGILAAMAGQAQPTLSVITPAYNSASFLGETLDSVGALRTDHEHLVMDGGSDDGSVELLEARDDPRLEWVSEPDRGQTHAVNKGLERSRGELIAWLNADDAYLPENVDRCLAELVASPEVDAVFGFMDVVDQDGRPIKQYRCGPFNWLRYLYFGHYMPTPTIIVRRRLLEKAPQLDERYADAADYDFYLRLLRGARVKRFRESLVRFRYHDTSKTASNVGLQQREAMDVRMTYARNQIERALMRGADRVIRARNAVISPWPELDESSRSSGATPR